MKAGEQRTCVGRLVNGPEKRYAVCATCGRIASEGNEGDPCGRILARVTLQCSSVGRSQCKGEVTHIDHRGFVACSDCGARRKASGERCRKLRPGEIARLSVGLTIHY